MPTTITLRPTPTAVPILPALVRPEWRQQASRRRDLTNRWVRLSVDLRSGSTVMARRLPSGRLAFAFVAREF
jgi:hypothetical protein